MVLKKYQTANNCILSHVICHKNMWSRSGHKFIATKFKKCIKHVNKSKNRLSTIHHYQIVITEIRYICIGIKDHVSVTLWKEDKDLKPKSYWKLWTENITAQHLHLVCYIPPRNSLLIYIMHYNQYTVLRNQAIKVLLLNDNELLKWLPWLQNVQMRSLSLNVSELHSISRCLLFQAAC